MTDKQRFTAPRDVSYDDYLTTSLTDPAEAAAYLDAVIEMEDTPALLLALRQVTKVLHAMGLRLSVEPLHTHA